MAKKYSLEELDNIEQQFKELLEGNNTSYIVADASAVTRNTIMNALKTFAAENIIQCKNGQLVFQELEKIETNVVIIIDIDMPLKSGLQVLHKLRTTEQTFKTPVILMVNRQTKKEHLMAAAKLGATAIIMKPFEQQTLIDKLKDIRV